MVVLLPLNELPATKKPATPERSTQGAKLLAQHRLQHAHRLCERRAGTAMIVQRFTILLELVSSRRCAR